MIIVDTSVWVDHFRNPDERFSSLLDSRLVVLHPFVLGELAMGNLEDRSSTLKSLGKLNKAVAASDVEVLALVERMKLYGKGVGFVDIHLLASALLMAGKLWTKDRRLAEIAKSCGVAYEH